MPATRKISPPTLRGAAKNGSNSVLGAIIGLLMIAASALLKRFRKGRY